MNASLYLVTGSSGFLGINLVRFLLANNQRVRCLDIAPFDYPERDAVEIIEGDVRDPAVVNRAMQGVDVVVHSAAALPLYKAADIYSTEVDGTRVLLEAVTKHGVARFIFISSTAVYGIPDKCPIREDDATVGVGPYGEAKIEAEKICLSFREAGLCVPILRPKTFIGPERLGVFELLYDWAFEGRNFPVIGSGENLYQLLDVWDLCVAIFLCATREPDLVNDTFNVGAAEFGTMRDNFQAVLDRAGHGGKVIGFPAAPVIAILKFAEWLHLSPLYQWIYETADHDSAVSIDRIQKKLQFQPRYSNEQAMVRNYDWYAGHRNDYRGLTGASHRLPWKRGVLGLVKYFF